MKLSYLFQKSLDLILLFTLSQCGAVTGSVQINALWGKTDLVLAHYEDCRKRNVEYNRFEKTTSLLSNAGGIDIIKSVNEIDKWTPPAKNAAERKKACAGAKAESLSCDEPDPLGGKGGALCKHIYHAKEVMCARGT